MKSLHLILFLLALIFVAPNAFGKNLCNVDEEVAFSCKTKRKKPKYLSLCGSKGWAATTGSLTYRYGKPGKIELAYPSVASKKPLPGESFQSRQEAKESLFENPIGPAAEKNGFYKGHHTMNAVGFGIKDVIYNIIKTSATYETVDYFQRPIEGAYPDKPNELTYKINITLPSKKVVSIHCKNEGKPNDLESTYAKLNPPKSVCLPEETEKKRCENKGGRTASVCVNPQGRIFARFLNQGKPYSFAINPTKENPIWLVELMQIRSMSNVQIYKTTEGIIQFSKEDGARPMEESKMEHYPSKTTVSCPDGMSITEDMPKAPTKEISPDAFR